jgi:hypothetical protein
LLMVARKSHQKNAHRPFRMPRAPGNETFVAGESRRLPFPAGLSIKHARGCGACAIERRRPTPGSAIRNGRRQAVVADSDPWLVTLLPAVRSEGRDEQHGQLQNHR